MIVPIGKISIGDGNPLVLFAGPCVVESREMILKTAEQVQKTAQKYSTPVVFKSSYKKANRTSGTSFVGIGMDEALKILEEVKKELGLLLLTDIHTEQEAPVAAQVVDVLQIPAFLCRQTELLHAAGRTGKVINIKQNQIKVKLTRPICALPGSRVAISRKITARWRLIGYGIIK